MEIGKVEIGRWESESGHRNLEVPGIGATDPNLELGIRGFGNAESGKLGLLLSLFL